MEETICLYFEEKEYLYTLLKYEMARLSGNDSNDVLLYNHLADISTKLGHPADHMEFAKSSKDFFGARNDWDISEDSKTGNHGDKPKK